MKYYRLILFPIIILTVLFSCSRNRMTPVNGGALSDNNFQIPPTGGTFSVVFTTDRDWSITEMPAWIKVDNHQGSEGTTVLKFVAGCNSTRESRSSRIAISADDGSFLRHLIVTQAYPYLNVMNQSLDITKEFDYNEDSSNDSAPFEIHIRSNIDWIIRDCSDADSSDLSNFDLSSLSGKNDDTLEVLPKRHNFGIEPYKAVFMIVPVMKDPDSNVDGSFVDVPEEAADSYTVYLSQDNFLFLLNGSPDECLVEFSELDNMSVSAEVTIEAERPWTVTDAPDWIRMSNESGQTQTLSISPDGVTPTSEERNGVILLCADAETPVYREIIVRQNGYTFELEGLQKMSFAWDDSTKHVVTLRTTGSWEILNIPDWLEVDPVSCVETTQQSGIMDYEISMRVKEENLGFEQLVSGIVFSRQEKPYNVADDPMDIGMEVVHEAFVFELDPSPVLGRIPTFNTKAYPVTVRCSGGWEIESSSDWVGISEHSGEEGGETIMFNAMTPNPNMDQDRTAVVEFVSLRHKSMGVDARRSFEIRQRKYAFEISAPELQDIPAYKSVYPGYAANLICSAEWELTEWPDWLTPNVTSGDGLEDVDIMFTPEYNASSSLRSGTIRLRDVYMDEEISVTASQDAFVFDASDRTFLDVPVMNDASYPVMFDMTAEAPWRVASCPSWIIPSAMKGESPASGSVSLSFTPEPNPEESQRSGIIIIESILNSEEKSIEFVQEQYEFDDSRVNLHFTELSDERNTVEVECSGPWRVDAPSWVIVSPPQGATSQVVHISVENNVTLQSREASFTLLSTLNGLTRQIDVEQDPYEFDSSSETFEFTALDNDDEEFEVLCSGSWQVDNVLPSWIILSDTRGNGSEDGEEQTVILSVHDCLEEYDRDCIIRIKSDDNASLTKEITVRQERFILDVSESSCEFRADDSRRISVSVTCSDDWIVSASDNWVNISGVSSTRFQISVDENEEASVRTSTVTVRNARSGIFRTIEIIQEGA